MYQQGLASQQHQGFSMDDQNRRLQAMSQMQQLANSIGAKPAHPIGPVYKFMKSYNRDLIEITTRKKRTTTIKIEDFDVKNPLHINAKLDSIIATMDKNNATLEEKIMDLRCRTPRFGWKK